MPIPLLVNKPLPCLKLDTLGCALRFGTLSGDLDSIEADVKPVMCTRHTIYNQSRSLLMMLVKSMRLVTRAE